MKHGDWVVYDNGYKREIGRAYLYTFCPYCSKEVREKLTRLERWGLEDLKEVKE